MEFCPTCGMLLQFEMPSFGRGARFFCPTCPYVCQIENKAKIKKKQHLVKKELEAVISKDDFRNLAQTEGMKTTEDKTTVTNYTLSSRLLHDSCQSKISNFNFSMISVYKDIITFQVPVNYRWILRVKEV
ncbi:hypothetical protein RJ640_008901 [Escallonia rubra]|uniref:DNA-directed RNA polymerase II subunit RPB9-like zinc ribbon domain-containing protein n=1 Tax=Escallonia rubra TaxID=112253 RepID=A0AA88QHR6_9ASTE|nr:hypothetical protein RJ640_008901 [Escallonia rubra]